MAEKRTGVAARVREAVEELITNAGYKLWNVDYFKEGPEMILEISIDKEGGVSINDCAVVTRIIEPVIDELDPIEESYCLQVSSAGTVRPLTREEHIRFAAESGIQVNIGLFTAIDGSKELTGVIEDFSGDEILLNCGGRRHSIPKKQITKINAEFGSAEGAAPEAERDKE